MAIATALHSMQEGQIAQGRRLLTRVLENFAESPVFDEQLRKELAPYWKPKETQ